jgi:hypothetical protein
MIRFNDFVNHDILFITSAWPTTILPDVLKYIHRFVSLVDIITFIVMFLLISKLLKHANLEVSASG